MGGCCSRPNSNDLYEPLLGDNEREAVSNLLQYLESRPDNYTQLGEALGALTTLSYSSNLELQRSAALTFAEITEKEGLPVERDFLQPILHLVRSTDTEVQRASSAALGNLAVNDRNKMLIVDLNGLDLLVNLLQSSNVEVQCNACGCVTNLATFDDNKIKIANSGLLPRLIRLANSDDVRVQRNATGALLNLTHADRNRPLLVQNGALPVLSHLLTSHQDTEIQYYCAAALSNLAVDGEHRGMIMLNQPEIINGLIGLLHSPAIKVQSQATLALRNLASDESFQLEIVERGALPPLLRLLTSPNIQVVLAAVAALRNISIHPKNEVKLVQTGFLGPLLTLMSYDRAMGAPAAGGAAIPRNGSNGTPMSQQQQQSSPIQMQSLPSANDPQGRTVLDIRCHAVSCIRNIMGSNSSKAAFASMGGVERLVTLLPNGPAQLQSEMAACVAVLALSESMRELLARTSVVKDLLTLMSTSDSVEVQGNSAAALGNLASSPTICQQFVPMWSEACTYLTRFLTSPNSTFVHIAIWSLYQLAKQNILTDQIKTSHALMDSIRMASTNQDVEIAKLANKTLMVLGEENSAHLYGSSIGSTVGSAS